MYVWIEFYVIDEMDQQHERTIYFVRCDDLHPAIYVKHNQLI